MNSEILEFSKTLGHTEFSDSQSYLLKIKKMVEKKRERNGFFSIWSGQLAFFHELTNSKFRVDLMMV